MKRTLLASPLLTTSVLILVVLGPALRTVVAASFGLEWSGDGPFRRMLYWHNPFPIYDATYVFRVFPRKKTTGSARYYTTFFWGNDGHPPDPVSGRSRSIATITPPAPRSSGTAGTPRLSAPGANRRRLRITSSIGTGPTPARSSPKPCSVRPGPRPIHPYRRS